MVFGNFLLTFWGFRFYELSMIVTFQITRYAFMNYDVINIFLIKTLIKGSEYRASWLVCFKLSFSSK